VVVQVLEGENAVKRNRDIMGATNPEQRRRGHDPQGAGRVDRGQFGPRLGQRRECAIEIDFFFKPEEIVGSRRRRWP
jgi:nucleoside-diphosphate kinase